MIDCKHNIFKVLLHFLKITVISRIIENFLFWNTYNCENFSLERIYENFLNRGLFHSPPVTVSIQIK